MQEQGQKVTRYYRLYKRFRLYERNRYKLQLNSVASGRIQARSDSVRRQELAQRLIARIAAPCKLLGQRKGEGTGLLSTCKFFIQF